MCAIVGVYNTPDAAELTRLGLLNLQHRGQEWVGMLTSDGKRRYPDGGPFKQRGLANIVLTPTVMESMMGHMAVGHLRYSTQGSSNLSNAQPHQARTDDGEIFFCSNGDLLNCDELRGLLRPHDFTFDSWNDGEVIVKLLAHCYNTTGHEWIPAIQKARSMLNGSYSGVLMTWDRIFLIRDPLENRPYCYTVAPDGAVFFASETAALDIMTADYAAFKKRDYGRHEVSRGVIIELAHGKLIGHVAPTYGAPLAHCMFELIYFARPDSFVFGISVQEFRCRLGRALAREAQPHGDLVSSVPDSSNDAANALAQAAGIPFRSILVRSHYTGRTFIEPEQQARTIKVKEKFNPVRCAIPGKEIVLVDDSIVRGNTSQELVHMIKRYGPKRIVLLITCPPIFNACYYGIDMKDHLIAADKKGDIDAIKRWLGLESHDELRYLSMDGLRSCVDNPKDWCNACWDGKYPTDVSGYVPLRR